MPGVLRWSPAPPAGSGGPSRPGLPQRGPAWSWPTSTRNGRGRRRRGSAGAAGRRGVGAVGTAGGRAAAAEIGGADVALGVGVDVTDGRLVAEAVERALLGFGGVDLVVNNAGLSVSKPVLQAPQDDWDTTPDP